MAQHALILAGGRGTRFWPRSRAARAKQVLDFLGAGSLIQQTVERLAPVVPPERIWVLTSPALQKEIVKQLPQVPKRQILAEPAQRNTAPAIGLAARILESVDPKALLGVFPADHYIAKPKDFLRLVRAAYREAAQDRMALLGIQARWPETGYGYLEFAQPAQPGSLTPVPLARFREKPALPLAKKFVKSGRHAWNAGMFFWKPQVYLQALRRFLPQTAAHLDALPPFSSPAFSRKLSELFPRCENISVDYAVLEKARGVVGFAAADIGWNDVGSWNAVYELLPKDAAGNATRGDVVLLDSRNSYAESAAGKPVALVGVDDLVVVDTPDAILVTRRDRAQSVGDLVKLLEKQGRRALL